MRRPVLLCLLIASPLAGCAHWHHREPAEVRFVVLGDSQFNHPDVFERLIHGTELLHPHFAIQVGDLINGYHHDLDRYREEWDRFHFQIAPLTVPFHPVPGNHDVITPEGEAIYGEVWGEDRYVYSFDRGPVHCVVLDTYHGEEDDTLGEWQIDWLANDLAAYAARHGGEGSERLERHSIFAFMHAPLHRYGADSAGRQAWDRVHEILTRYPVRAVFTGHSHEYVWEERDGITYVVLNSSGYMGQYDRHAGRFHESIHVTVNGGNEVEYAVIPWDSVLPIDTVNSDERRENARLFIRPRTFRIADPAEAPLDETISFSLENNLGFDRNYELTWQIPWESSVSVEPERRRVTVAPGGSEEIAFQLRAPQGTSRAALPHLRVASAQTLRSGVVPRDWEARYREDRHRHERDSSVRVTEIPLDEEVVFSADWELAIPPRATSARRESEIRIDATIDEAAWGHATPINDFTTAEGEEADVHTSVRLLWDEDHLYVAAAMQEPTPGGMRANAGGDIPLVWGDDDFELFLDAGMTQRRFVRLFQNCAGTRFNSRPIGTPDNLFQSEYESAVAVGVNNWTLEMAIPWSETGTDGPPEPGDQWGLNVWRHRQQSHEALSQWSVMRNFPYEASKFGILEFE